MSSGFVQNAAGGTVIHVRATANARENAIIGIETRDDDKSYLKLKVRTIAEDGAANKAIIELLAKALNLPRSNFDILSGAKSRTKSIFVKSQNIDIEAHIKDYLDQNSNVRKNN